MSNRFANSKHRRATGRIVALTLIVGLGGCASGANTANMTASLRPNLVVPTHSPMRESLTIEKVSGGETTNPLWTSKVSNASFNTALKSSLHQQRLYATGQPKFTVAAHLVELKQPLMGIDMTVSSKVRYVVRRASDGKVVYDQTVPSSYTATFSDSMIGVERLRMANEGAIKQNITKFITKISTLSV